MPYQQAVPGYPPTYPAPQQYSGTGYGQHPGAGYGPPATSALSRQLTGLPQALLSGDWVGAVTAVVVGLGAMLGLALLAELLADTSTGSTTGSQILGEIAVLVAMACGGTLSAAADELGASADLSFRPLGLTFLGFSLIAILFVRRLRRRGNLTGLEVGLQAVRLATVLAVGLLVVAMLSRVGSSSSPAKVGVVSTMFFGVVTLAIALVPAVILALPGVLPPRAEHYRIRVTGPMRGILVLTVTTCVATLVALVLYAVSLTTGASEGAELTSFWRGVIATLLLFLPNVAGAAVLFGIGVPATGAFGGSFGLADSSSGGSVSILDAVDAEPRFWILPAVLILLLIVAGMVSARRSPVGQTGRPMIVWFPVVLSVALFVLSLNLSVTAGGGAAGLFLGGSVGFDYLLTIVFGAIAGLLAGLAAAAVTRRAVPQPASPPSAPYPA